MRGRLQREDLDISWQCEHGLHGSCRVTKIRPKRIADGSVKMKPKQVPGDYSNCGCECHEVEFCYMCKCAPCQCDAIYEPWRDQEDERRMSHED